MIKATVGASAPRELIPSGSHIARCYEMVHIGTVTEKYMGEEEREIDKVRLSFELPNELRVFNEDKGEQPMVTSIEYTLSMHEKANLRRHLETWRGQGFTENEADNFDITALLGVPCMLSIIHVTSKKNGNTYANIGGISGLPQGVKCPPQINPSREFNFNEKFDLDYVESLPNFIKDKIKSSKQYNARIEYMNSAEETKKQAVAMDGQMDNAVQRDNTTGSKQADYKVADKDPGATVSDDLPFIITVLLSVGTTISMLL